MSFRRVSAWALKMIFFVERTRKNHWPWQFCWWPFWDGENVTLLNGCWWPPTRGWKGHKESPGLYYIALFFSAKNVARHAQHRVESSTFSKTFCEMSCQNSTLQRIKGNVPYFPVKRNMLEETKSTMFTSFYLFMALARYNQKKC